MTHAARPVRLLCSALLAALVAGVLLSACGGGSSSSSADADPATVVPATAPVYVELALDPDGDQGAALSKLAGRLSGGKGADALAQELTALARTRGARLDYAQDVKPWLGKRLAVAMLGGTASHPQGVVVAAATDADKARDALAKGAGANARKASYGGVSYTVGAKNMAAGVVDGFAVVGDQRSFRAVVAASKDKDLAAVPRFATARQQAPDDRIGLVYASPSGLISLAESGVPATGLIGNVRTVGQLIGPTLTTPFVATVKATDKGIVVDEVSHMLGGILGTKSSALLGELPGDAWLAGGIHDPGALVHKVLQTAADATNGTITPAAMINLLRGQTGVDLQGDLLRWLGDAAIFARGTSKQDFAAGAVIEVRDQAAAQHGVGVFVHALVPALLDGAKISGSSPDMRITAPKLAAPITTALRGKRLAIVMGSGDNPAAAALTPKTRLADDPGFHRDPALLGDGYQLIARAALGPAATLLATLGKDKTTGLGAALAPALGHLGDAVLGTKGGGAKPDARLVLPVK